jgi:integrase
VSKKRGNGEGTIHRRKGGGWCAQYTVYTANGRKRKTLYGRTRAEVAAKLAKALSDREGGITFDADSLRLGDYLQRWLEDSKKGSVKRVTYEGYARQVRNHLVPTLGRIKLKALKPAHLRGLYREKSETGLSARTVGYIHATIHNALEQAVKDGLLPRNVADAVKPPQLCKEEIQPLTPAQTKSLLEAVGGETVGGDRFEALYVLAVTAGLRQGELLGLKWEDIALDRGLLQVRRTLSNTKGGEPVFSDPKTARGRRSVKLTARAVEALKRHRERQLEEREEVAGLWQNHGLVFPTQVGTAMSRHNLVARSFKPLLKRAGLPEIRFHDLRHTCATLMLAVGANPKVAQETLGHANVTITLDTYSHLLPNMQDEVAEKVNELLS